MRLIQATILSFVILISLSENSYGQQDKKVIQFSGIVVDMETEMGIPGVHIYAPKGGRGTTTNPYGYFSMAILEGDSLVVSSISYEKENIKVPTLPFNRDNFTVVITLQRDTTYLEELEVYPFPSEQMFKEAVLALQLPNQYDLDNMQQNVDRRMLNKMSQGLTMGADGNYEYYMNQQSAAYNRQFQPNSISLLNPFAWNQFIKSLKKKDSER
ncbi:carboxypeptidase-like regulatory domain-containing protein [Reichenbachiella agarivorans]|uniref:Carboxypeptidase-like regulatory domain-containing protein n=1 Tax=Reichenbachiella agarivorans TaxID=2979464 RepID=A0ABY6CSX9_9BACT|nr:carboxypeptidase-like regulatory domain-containing protein [Reichenbachiella agarivorans]UXP33622.1 carboxypeptidase-like regulatory domain-containing protein [Reichenbachiella agarivorans]